MNEATALLQLIINELQKPLLEKIEAQDKRIAEMETFFNNWNFGNEEKFKEAVSSAVDECFDGFAGTIDEKVREAVEEIDIEDAVRGVINNGLEITFSI